MTTMTEARPPVTGGVDTHLDVHVAAALDQVGGVLATASFPTTAAGYRQLLTWLRAHGPIDRVGVEGTGSYGAALARHLTGEGVTVIEVAGMPWSSGSCGRVLATLAARPSGAAGLAGTGMTQYLAAHGRRCCKATGAASSRCP